VRLVRLTDLSRTLGSMRDWLIGGAHRDAVRKSAYMLAR
jgi:hypothetical protein